ncbi:hypothetical protein E0485_02825 [Paenibacillus albiflavus]|uniref:Lipoprotein n=1 Tax=Paenibacillus albiflavus TaxID=2545760 RepID=A0A4R4ENN9_9BACL|nr:hypothetical protein [Paenibacillus albiflavus]TCZ81223.1 hypothetical protein E0485_02825 [Paenibacillus albiflavus]
MKPIHKRWRLLVLLCLISTLLSGCFYPKDQMKQNQTNPEEYITVVQGAVDKYREIKGGLLPILNSTMETPIYEKYKVDFKKLQEYRLLTTVPANAFENGGSYIYVIVNPEKDPKIKLIDVAAYQSVNQAQQIVSKYIVDTNGKLPQGQLLSKGIAELDWEVIKEAKPTLQSTYNRMNEISYLLQDTGVVTIDYSFDLMKLIDSKSLQNTLTADEDLRELLIANTPFMPIHSVPYHWIDGRPVPQTK